MKIDEIQDIEVLRNELKKHMIKCVEDFTTLNYKNKEVHFKAGEYYYVNQDSDYGADIYDYSQNVDAFVESEDIDKHFEIYKTK